MRSGPWYQGLTTAVLVLLFTALVTAQQQQMIDPTFRPSVDAPAYRDGGPTVGIDEAHANYHTATGPYQPFADLLRADGYFVRASVAKFAPGALQGIDVLVVANARGGDATGAALDAFTDEECDALQDWVREGGALLLIADHAPFGSAADLLARHFGVVMGKGYAFEQAGDGRVLTDITFSSEAGSLGSHAILRGRNASEEVNTIETFAGQSLVLPEDATALLPFGPLAREAVTAEDFGAELEAARSGGEMRSRSVSISGRAQGLALPYGKGRIVVLGEAGMLTAQVLRSPDGTEQKFGMNVDSNDNLQFALNVMHWLSGLLP